VARCLCDGGRSAARELTSATLWERAACLACEAGVGGVLDQALRRQRIDIPDGTSAILTAYRQHLAARNAYQVRRAGRVLGAVIDAGIPFLLLKGAALNATLYEKQDLRGMSDIDVLILPDDVERIDRTLRSTGCDRGPDPVRRDFFPRFYYEREYLTGDRPPVRLDVHVRPFRPLYYAQTVPPDGLWDKHQTITFGGRQVTVPDRENMLIHLCVHAACHGLSHLRWSYDIKKYVDVHGDHINWDEIERTARRWRLTYPVRLALEHVAEIFESDDPILRRAIARMRDRPDFRDRLAIKQAPRDATHSFSHVVTDLICLRGIRPRLSYLSGVTFPAKAHMGQWYRRRHPGWLPIAHLTRVIKGLVRVLVPRPSEP